MKIFAILAAKLLSWGLSLLHRGGSFPGSIALKIKPNILSSLKIEAPIIIITGTNGKTSTSNMIGDLFETTYSHIIQNRKGDNLKEGITTALLQSSTLLGCVKADVIVLETDELNVPYIMKHLPVSTLVVTNFFRDQLDRSSEMEQLIQKIERAITDFEGNLIINGDDPNVVRLVNVAKKANPIFFGCEENAASQKESFEASEGKFCPRCHAPLQYAFYQYSHIGEFSCSKCDFKTPNNKLTAKNINIAEGTFIYEDICFKAPVASLYAVYNCMAVCGVAKQYHMDLTSLQRVFQNVQQPAGRNETFYYKNIPYTLNLVKNPTGTNEVLKNIEQDQDTKILMIVLNDNAQDGTDVSWIYDAQFERVLNLSTETIICSGSRAYDMALRIKYANYEKELIVIEDYHKALDTLYTRHMKGYVIATYTALHAVRSAMRKDGA